MPASISWRRRRPWRSASNPPPPAEAETQDLTAEVRQAWDSLDRLPGKAERALAERLAAAAAATPAALAQGRETREALLLDLEIALGLPSPEPYGEARRERQLGSLQHRFKGGEAPTQDPEDLVARWYATAAAPDESQEQRMAAVVQHLADSGSGR